jgi:putative pyruvate formate lyase activating enzyme
MMLSVALAEKTQKALVALENCRMCPRDCGVNRLQNAWSACKTGRYAIVDCDFAHFGEEYCLRGWKGSGTIFFSHCNLRCVFCQNYDISQAVAPGPAVPGSPPEVIADMMLDLQRQGCHNINFVTPEHVVAQIIESVAIAVERGLSIPIVYNTSAYDALDSIELMNGIADIYMPDFKFWSAERSKLYMKAEDYPDVARRVIRAMHNQVGDLVINENGLARRGLLIRHLVMPGMLDETRSILEWIAAALGTNTYINLMDQYHPAGKVSAVQYHEINRRTLSSEFLEAKRIAWSLGLHRLDDGM